MRARTTSFLVAAVAVLALVTTVAGILGPGLVRQARDEKVRGRQPGPPEGVPVPIHDLLLARAQDVEALAELASQFGGSDPE